MDLFGPEIVVADAAFAFAASLTARAHIPTCCSAGRWLLVPTLICAVCRMVDEPPPRRLYGPWLRRQPEQSASLQPRHMAQIGVGANTLPFVTGKVLHVDGGMHIPKSLFVNAFVKERLAAS